ncbi:MAG: hypothetical protein AB8G15_06190 [Saprospiraceae bacterium]
MSDVRSTTKWQAGLKESYQSSIYWNAQPSPTGTIDLYYADINDLTFATNWGEQLIGKNKIALSINASVKEKDHLLQIFTDTKNRKNDHSFGFGFPFFIYHDPEKNVPPIVAPLFIWELTIKPNPTRLDTWVIQHDETNAIKINEYLVDHLEQSYNFKLKAQWQELALKKEINHQSLSKICHELIVELSLTDGRTNVGINPFPKQEELTELLETGAIHWSGVLGAFPYVAPSVLRNTQITPPPLRVGNYEHSVALFRNDPFQKEAILALAQHELIQITGHQGTGKTYTLNNILCNALSNGKKSLVISKNAQSFVTIQNLLQSKGLEHLSLVLHNDHKDKLHLLEQLRNSVQRTAEVASFDPEEYQLLLNQYERAHQKLDKAYEVLNKNIFGAYSWTETVGQFLANNRLEGKELLASQLNPQDFIFSFEEYEILKAMVKETEPIYKKIPTLKHPLNTLAGNIFSEKEKAEAESFLEDRLKHFIDKAADLQHRYILKLDAYVHQLREHYEDHYQSLDQQLEITKNKIADYSSQFGAAFESSSVVNAGKLRVYGVFSDKHKSILQAKEDVAKEYERLLALYDSRTYFEYEFPRGEDYKNMTKIRQALADFASNLQHWRHRNPGIIQEQVQKLSNQTVHPSLNFKPQINELEYALDVLIAEINTTGIYQAYLKNNRLTIPMRQQFLEDIIEQLETSLYHLRDFDNFYDWRKHWLPLPEKSKKLIRAIIKVKPRHWTAAFESWYLHHHLLLNHQAQLPDSDILLQQFIELDRRLCSILPTQVRDFWKKRQAHTLKEFKRVDRERYQLIFASNDQQTILERPLKALFQIDFPAFTDMFPVVMLSPELAAEVLPDMEQFFDLVLFDEAQEISSELAFPAWKLGKQVVVAGDAGQYRQATNDSILAYATEQQAKAISLAYLHQEIAPSIARFKNKYLYQQSLKLLRSGLEESRALQAQSLKGEYHAPTQTNSVEIDAILSALQAIEKTPEHRYPRVAIICFTRAQRDAIQLALIQLQQLQQPGYHKIEALEAAGLALYHWEEKIEAMEVALLSLTYGTSKKDSEIETQLQILNTPKGFAQLRMIFSLPLYGLSIFHSLSAETVANFLQQPERQGSYLLVNGINYAHQLAHGQAMIEESKLTAAQLRGSQSKRFFVEEVAQALQPYLEPGRTHLNASTENLSLSLVIKALSKNAANFVLQTDGFFSDAKTGAYTWEQYLREEVTFLGLETLPTWSINWWKNPSLEARKLASIIIRNDTNSFEKASIVTGEQKTEVGLEKE